MEVLEMGEMSEQKKYVGLLMCIGHLKKAIFQMLKHRIWNRVNG